MELIPWVSLFPVSRKMAKFLQNSISNIFSTSEVLDHKAGLSVKRVSRVEITFKLYLLQHPN